MKEVPGEPAMTQNQLQKLALDEEFFVRIQPSSENRDLKRQRVARCLGTCAVTGLGDMPNKDKGFLVIDEP